MMRPNRADRMLGRRAWVSCNAGRTFKSITAVNTSKIHGINRLTPDEAHIVHDSKHVSASGQVLGESIGLILVCKVCLDKNSRKMSGRTTGNAYDRPTLFG